MTESWQLPSPALGSKLQMVFALYSLFMLPFISWMHTLNFWCVHHCSTSLTIVTPLSSVCMAGQLHVSEMLHAEVKSQRILFQVLRKGAGLQQSI